MRLVPGRKKKNGRKRKQDASASSAPALYFPLNRGLRSQGPCASGKRRGRLGDKKRYLEVVLRHPLPDPSSPILSTALADDWVLGTSTSSFVLARTSETFLDGIRFAGWSSTAYADLDAACRAVDWQANLCGRRLMSSDKASRQTRQPVTKGLTTIHNRSHRSHLSRDILSDPGTSATLHYQTQ